jgi:hypothetical protein
MIVIIIPPCLCVVLLVFLRFPAFFVVLSLMCFLSLALYNTHSPFRLLQFNSNSSPSNSFIPLPFVTCFFFVLNSLGSFYSFFLFLERQETKEEDETPVYHTINIHKLISQFYFHLIDSMELSIRDSSYYLENNIYIYSQEGLSSSSYGILSSHIISYYR